ncbi:hypothetical protein [Herbidospora cretacea]|uniref:hypothetical protein n=1 Tax=Herbidospora cretacea TaxID=28444 RepID=UPI000B229232|nr:hypothetical protein [Herbidospora cretacea]
MNTKKVLTYVAIAFVIFYLFTQPQGAAGAVRGAFDAIGNGADALAQFFTELFA